MKNQKFHINKLNKEILFQGLLHILVFIFYAVDRKNPQIETYEVAFFLSLALVAFLINYLLFPKFLYQQKYISFIASASILILCAFLTEELILEQIYFPDTRGSKFSSLFYTLIGILPAIITLIGFKLGWDLIGKQQQLEELEGAIKESELQYLKSQINPHFLFNNMNNLYAHAIENSPKTPDIILELSAVLRYMLYDCKAQWVPLNKEIKQLQNFINISELQIEERGQVNFNAPAVSNNYQIAPLILMVFVENAFKHSTASQSEDISIAVNITMTEQGLLNFSCHNSFAQQSNTDSLSSGIGLANVKKRLELLYPNAYKLNIQNHNNQYKVDLSVQLIESLL